MVDIKLSVENILFTRFRGTKTDFPYVKNLITGNIHYDVADGEIWFMLPDICRILGTSAPEEVIRCISKKNSTVLLKTANNYSEIFINLDGVDEIIDLLPENLVENAAKVRALLVHSIVDYVGIKTKKKDKPKKKQKNKAPFGDENISAILGKIQSIVARKDNEIKKLNEKIAELKNSADNSAKNGQISDKVKNAIIDYYNESKDHTYVTTASQFGVGTSTVYRILAENKIAI